MSRTASTKMPTGGRRRAKRQHTGSGRVRALLGLGTVAFLALGFGAQGTFAFWTDQATVQSGTFSSGTLDITLNNQLAGPSNNGKSTTLSFGLIEMVPGESRAVQFPIANVGDVGVTYSVSGLGSGDLAAGLQFTIATGTATNPVQSSGLRTGACSGASISGAPKTLTTSLPATPLVGGPRGLAKSATETICVIASLPTSADNSLQGKTMTANIIFDAKQVGAP